LHSKSFCFYLAFGYISFLRVFAKYKLLFYCQQCFNIFQFDMTIKKLFVSNHNEGTQTFFGTFAHTNCDLVASSPFGSSLRGHFCAPPYTIFNAWCLNLAIVGFYLNFLECASTGELLAVRANFGVGCVAGICRSCRGESGGESLAGNSLVLADGSASEMESECPANLQATRSKFGYRIYTRTWSCVTSVV
jgi:hypothetical protein